MALTHATTLSPRRRAQLGAFRLDMFFMILMIVAILAVATFAILEAGDVARDESYVAAAESFTAETETAVREGRLALESATAIVGADKATFDQQWMKSSIEMPAYSEPGVDTADGSRELANGKFKSAKNPANGTKLFGTAVDMTLSDAILETDRKINALISVHNSWDKLSVKIAEASAAAATAYDQALIAHMTEVEDAVKKFKESLASAQASRATANDAANAEHNKAFEAAETSFREFFNVVHNAALGETGDDARTSMHEALSNVRLRIEALNKLREDVMAQYARNVGHQARRNDFKGYIIDADRDNGWAWINLGQMDNVRTGITFDVQRPSPDGTGMMDVARIQVNTVLVGGGARCRVISVVGENFPEGGDSLLQANFSTESYLYYSLIGDFDDRYSREELVRLLEDHDMVVHKVPTNKTQVLILGTNWQQDPRVAGLGEDKTFPNHVKWTEKDLLYKFGIIGPVSKR